MLSLNFFVAPVLHLSTPPSAKVTAHLPLASTAAIGLLNVPSHKVNAVPLSSKPQKISKNIEHYIEWDNVETQVRLIDKIEEILLGTQASTSSNLAYRIRPGCMLLRHGPRMDSEFAPGESGMSILPKSIFLFTTQLEGLGCGKKRNTARTHRIHLQMYQTMATIHPSSVPCLQKFFNRYIKKKLRSLRPDIPKKN